MQCLNCQRRMTSKSLFSNIFILKKEKDGVCQECQVAFERISNDHCPYCYKDGNKKVCHDCQIWLMRGYDVQHKALYTYNQAMKDYFSRFKFQGDYLLAGLFSSDLRQCLKTYKDYTIVPIPLSNNRLKTRQFNQVESLLEKSGIRYLSLLTKIESQAQSSKTREERLATTQPFRIKETQILPSKILLIDDIYTTGTTIFLAHQKLKEHGVEEIISFSLAR